MIFCTNAFAQEPGRLEEQMHFLTDSLCEGRSTGSRGGALAAMWIAKEFSRLGLSETDSTWFRGFIAASGEKGRNVIGLLPGSVQGSRRRYILVGAHYDHIGTLGHTLYPGADSNASGVVSMLTLADLFSGDGKQYASSLSPLTPKCTEWADPKNWSACCKAAPSPIRRPGYPSPCGAST